MRIGWGVLYGLPKPADHEEFDHRAETDREAPRSLTSTGFLDAGSAVSPWSWPGSCFWHASYNFFLAGNIALWPATLTLTRLIGAKKPQWALWGGAFVMSDCLRGPILFGLQRISPVRLVRQQRFRPHHQHHSDAAGGPARTQVYLLM
jgi:hypothetical protein